MSRLRCLRCEGAENWHGLGPGCSGGKPMVLRGNKQVQSQAEANGLKPTWPRSLSIPRCHCWGFQAAFQQNLLSVTFLGSFLQVRGLVWEPTELNFGALNSEPSAASVQTNAATGRSEDATNATLGESFDGFWVTDPGKKRLEFRPWTRFRDTSQHVVLVIAQASTCEVNDIPTTS